MGHIHFRPVVESFVFLNEWDSIKVMRVAFVGGSSMDVEYYIDSDNMIRYLCSSHSDFVEQKLLEKYPWCFITDIPAENDERYQFIHRSGSGKSVFFIFYDGDWPYKVVNRNGELSVYPSVDGTGPPYRQDPMMTVSEYEKVLIKVDGLGRTVVMVIHTFDAECMYTCISGSETFITGSYDTVRKVCGCMKDFRVL